MYLVQSLGCFSGGWAPLTALPLPLRFGMRGGARWLLLVAADLSVAVFRVVRSLASDDPAVVSCSACCS